MILDLLLEEFDALYRVVFFLCSSISLWSYCVCFGDVKFLPFISATLLRKSFLSCSTRFRPASMNESNFTVNFAMRSRSSSNPKFMLGSESAIDGASAD